MVLLSGHPAVILATAPVRHGATTIRNHANALFSFVLSAISVAVSLFIFAHSAWLISALIRTSFWQPGYWISATSCKPPDSTGGLTGGAHTLFFLLLIINIVSVSIRPSVQPTPDSFSRRPSRSPCSDILKSIASEGVNLDEISGMLFIA